MVIQPSEVAKKILVGGINKKKKPEVPAPVTTPVTPPTPQPSPAQPVPVFQDKKTGDLSGFTDPKSGSTFLGVPPLDVKRFVDQQTAQSTIPTGAASQAQVAQAQQAQQQQIAAQALIPQIGQPSPVPGTGFDTGTALAASTPDLASTILSNAAVGAGVGALAGIPTAGALSVPGAIVGGIGGAIKGAATVVPQLREEFQQQRDVDFADYTTSVKNIKGIIDGVNKGIVDPVEAVDLYNHELAKIDRAEGDLKRLEEKNWLSKARKRLTQVQAFNDVQRSNTAQLLANAIAQPNPNAVYNLPQDIITPDEQVVQSD